MQRCLLILILALAASGCGKIGHHVDKITVDGTTCIEARSPNGVAIDCDWPPR